MPDRGEQQFIHRFLQQNSGNFIGDDCAIWNNKNLLITTDQMVEGVHFDLSFMTPGDVGWRLMAANASDIIAMGGKPSHYLCNIAIPKEKKAEANAIIDAISSFANRYNITLLGGDTTRSNTFFLAITMCGEMTEIPWKRSGAQVGDYLLIAEHPGLSAVGLHHLKKGDANNFPEATHRFLHPNPFSALPKECDGITAAIDISDSLLSEATILAQESGVTIEIAIDAIPHHPEVVSSAKQQKIAVEKLLLGSGEEFFLLATAQRPLLGWHTIGKVLQNTENRDVYVTKNNIPFSVDNITPFSHF